MTEDLNFHKKRRKVIRASLTKLGTKVTDLEGSRPIPGLLETAQSLSGKLKTLQDEFKTHRLKIINLTDAEETPLEEQQALDDNDDITSELNIQIQRLIVSATPSTDTDVIKVAPKELKLLAGKLNDIETSVNKTMKILSVPWRSTEIKWVRSRKN
jgi:hypothetical protein